MPLELNPPECVRGMMELDRSAFERKIVIPGLKIDSKHCSTLLKQLNKYLLNQPKLRNIVPDNEKNPKKKIALLNPNVVLNGKHQQFLKSLKCERVEYQLCLGYGYWNCDQVLRAVLPEDIGEVTTSFESIGHIAHMNLRESQLKYKKLIGNSCLTIYRLT